MWVVCEIQAEASSNVCDSTGYKCQNPAFTQANIKPNRAQFRAEKTSMQWLLLCTNKIFLLWHSHLCWFSQSLCKLQILKPVWMVRSSGYKHNTFCLYAFGRCSYLKWHTVLLEFYSIHLINSGVPWDTHNLGITSPSSLPGTSLVSSFYIIHILVKYD